MSRKVLFLTVGLAASCVAMPVSHAWVYVANGFDPFEQLMLFLSFTTFIAALAGARESAITNEG